MLSSVCVYNLDSNPFVTRPARRRLSSASTPFGPKAPINHSLIEFQQTHKTLIGFSYFILQTHVSGEPCKVICSGEPCHLELSRCSGWCLISRNMCCPRFDCHSWPDVRGEPYFWIEPRLFLSVINALWFYFVKDSSCGCSFRLCDLLNFSLELLGWQRDNNENISVRADRRWKAGIIISSCPHQTSERQEGPRSLQTDTSDRTHALCAGLDVERKRKQARKTRETEGKKEIHMSLLYQSVLIIHGELQKVLCLCLCVDSKLCSVIRTYAPLRNEKPYCELKRCCLISSFNTHLKWFWNGWGQCGLQPK